MKSIDGSLILSLKSGGEVGNVGSYVRLNTVNSEEEILGCSGFKLLTAKSNTLENNGKSYELSVISVCRELLGDVDIIEGLDSFVKDLSGTALDLHHRIVGSSRTGNTNSHTNLDAKLSNGIYIHLVGIVTAATGSIKKEEMVSGVAK